MAKSENKIHKFGLLGRDISYSFSKGYFTEKFKDLGLKDHTYENFDLATVEEFRTVLKKYGAKLKGLNVTIPYKEAIIPYLDDLDDKAKAVGAVNTIKITDGGLVGYNTDIHGFKYALLPMLGPQKLKALILGTGGASKAISFVLNELGISHIFVSRNPKEKQIHYEEINDLIFESHKLIINCTPIGTYPKTEAAPDIPYEFVGPNHLFFDLIYNPQKTRFLQLAEAQGATISNGLKMLELQAEKAWEIWNS